MSLYLVLTLLLLFEVKISFQEDIENLNEKDCVVKEVKSGLRKPCQFPFIFSNQTFYGCTIFKSDNGNPWCSTKVDPLDYEHVSGGGYYGDCPLPLDECPSAEKGLEAENNYIEYLDLSYEDADSLAIRAEAETDDCTCEAVKDCRWARNMISDISRLRLPRNHPTRKRAIDFIKDRVCKHDKSKKSVYCCKSGTWPTKSQVKLLDFINSGGLFDSRGENPFAPIEIEPDSGKWKPDGEKGECGQRINFSNIVGGSITKTGDFPYMALIGSITKSDGKVQYTCGGSLINKWYVLTAAHCLYNEDGILAKPDEVVFGEHVVGRDPDCNGGGEKRKCAPKRLTRKVATFKTHEKFTNTKDNNKYDIALLRLEKEVPLFSENPKVSFASPVCLPWKETDIGRNMTSGDRGLVTGWGRSTNDLAKFNSQFSRTRVGSRILRKVKVPILDNQSCSQFRVENDIQICAGGVKGKDSCNGDSGGPLVYKTLSDDPWYQTGIVSFGFVDECGSSNVPGVYTRVEAYLSWIENNLED